VILTVDLGTSATKVALWEDDGLQALGRAAVGTVYGPEARAEQDPARWWSSVVEACAAVRRAAPAATGAVDAVGFSAARQTFVAVTADGEALGPAMLWSDRRAGAEATALADACGGPDAMLGRTGVVLDAGAVAAKMAWLAGRRPDVVRRARWLATPRDLVLWRLTGVWCTDTTLASASGLYDGAGRVVPELAGDGAGLLLDPVAPDTVAGALNAGPADELGLRPGVPVVVGAGDRPCEVLGAGAAADRPMVSWGTTANVSVPVPERGDGPSDGLIVTRGATGGWLLEGGLSAAGSLLDWWARLTGIGGRELLRRAATSPPGARGVVALGWLGGARAPWWRAEARAAVLGLSAEHEAADVARAVVEGVAWDVARCLEVARRRGRGQAATAPEEEGFAGLALGGGGATMDLWRDVLTAVTGLPATRRRSGEAASAGAALLVGRALDRRLDLDALDPVVDETAPDRGATARYAGLRRRADQAAAAVIALSPAPGPDDSPPGAGADGARDGAGIANSAEP